MTVKDGMNRIKIRFTIFSNNEMAFFRQGIPETKPIPGGGRNRELMGVMGITPYQTSLRFSSPGLSGPGG